MVNQKNEFKVVDMINVLLDVIVEHGNIPIYHDTPISLEITEDKKGKYAIFCPQNQ